MSARLPVDDGVGCFGDRASIFLGGLIRVVTTSQSMAKQEAIEAAMRGRRAACPGEDLVRTPRRC
jgi:hypothetical protein